MIVDSDLKFYLEHLALGCLTQPLVRQGVPFACLLTNISCLVKEVLAALEQECSLTAANQDALASRLIFGRYPDELERLSKLWERAGSQRRTVESVVAATRAALSKWPAGFIATGSVLAYSQAHAGFVASLNASEISGDDGPIGRAVRASRFYAGSQSDGSLEGEKLQPVGFPVILSLPESGRYGTRIRGSAWLGACMDVPDSGAGQPDFMSALGRLLQQARDVLPQVAAARHEILRIPEPFAPIMGLSDDHELDSAGLGIALQRLSGCQCLPIPAGVGFTGRWEGRTLQAVTGIRGKLRAAREAGIFVLFACVDQAEAEELRQQGSEPGVTLALLPAGSSLDDVLVRVNTVCHDLGLTEYRWRRAVSAWEDRVLGRRDEASLKRLLPHAVERTCPVGFVGREDLLKELDQGKERPGSGHIALVGSPRSGKTTVLSQWVFHRPGVWPRPPVWFSFLRGVTGASTLADVGRTLTDQVRARYCILESRQPTDAPTSLRELMQYVAGLTQSRIDLVIDGLEEAEAGDQNEIARLLMSLPPGGLLVVGTQDVVAANVFKNRVMIVDRPDQGDAETLVSRFAARFTKSGKSGQLREIGSSLETAHWRGGFIEKSGGHLWILTEFLSWIEREGGEPWPDTPDGLRPRLARDVEHYCDLICKEIKRLAVDGWQTLSKLLVTLAVLDNQPWPVSDVMVLAGLSLCSEELERSQGLIDDHARRLVALEPRSRRIQFRDSYFQKYLRDGEDVAAREVTCRLIGLVGKEPGGDYSEDLICYAIARSAWHVSNDAKLEADRLVRETNWASARLALLADLREDDPPPDLLLNEMLSDLVRLEPLVKDGKTKEALRDLQRAIVDWRWAIRQSPELSPAWWNGLEAVRTHEVWSKQGPVATRPGVGGPVLLVPHTGYPTISPRQLRLRDVACELADGRIALVDTLDRYDQRLLIIDSETGNIEATHTLENIPPIRHIAACGPEHILLATELDRSGRAFILRIDLTDHTQVPLPLNESPDGLLVLAGPVVLVAVQRGAQAVYWRLDHQSMRSVGDEQQIEVPVWDSQTNEDPIERKFEVFAPGTWAQWSTEAMLDGPPYFVESGVQLFRLDESTDRIEDITTDEIRSASFGKRILGCHRLPNDALVIAFNFKDEASSKRGTAFIKVDCNGHIEFPPLRVQSPVGLLGCLCGYVLIRGGWPHPWLHSSLRLQPEAVPRILGFRIPIVDAIGQLGLNDGRLLLISETGALLVDADPRPIVRIGSPAWGDPIRSSHISGALRDGSVVIDEGSGIVEGSPDETGSYRLINYLGRVRNPWPAHLTRSGCVVRETDTSIEVSRSGLDGPFEDLIANKDHIRSALGLDGVATFRLVDIEDDDEGSWALLVRQDRRELILVQSHDGGSTKYFGCFDLGQNQHCEILGFYKSAVLIALDTEGSNREWYLIDSGNLIEEPPTWICMRPLNANWCLLWGHSDPWESERIYLLRTGSSEPPVPVEDLWLARDSFAVEALPAGDGSVLVAMAAIEENGQVLSIHRRELDPRIPALAETEAPCQAVLCEADQRDRATCWTKIDDRRIAVGYRSRRCEIIEIPRQPGRTRKVIRAVAYTPDEPTSMILSRGTEGNHLVVTAGGEVFWFGLSGLVDRRNPGR